MKKSVLLIWLILLASQAFAFSEFTVYGQKGNSIVEYNGKSKIISESWSEQISQCDNDHQRKYLSSFKENLEDSAIVNAVYNEFLENKNLAIVCVDGITEVYLLYKNIVYIYKIYGAVTVID